MSHAQYGEDQKLKIDTLVFTDIPRSLQGHTNKQKYVAVLSTKQHAYTLKEFLQFPLIICTRNAMNWPSFLEICFHHWLFYDVMDHDILHWHTKHFRGPSKPNKKYPAWYIAWRDYVNLFPSLRWYKKWNQTPANATN